MKLKNTIITFLAGFIMAAGLILPIKAESETELHSKGIITLDDGNVVFDSRDFALLQSAIDEGKAATRLETIEEIKKNPKDYGIGGGASGAESFSFDLGGHYNGYISTNGSEASAGYSNSITIPTGGHEKIYITRNSGCSISGNVSGALSNGSDISNDSQITIYHHAALLSPEGYSNRRTFGANCSFRLE